MNPEERRARKEKKEEKNEVKDRINVHLSGDQRDSLRSALESARIEQSG